MKVARTVREGVEDIPSLLHGGLLSKTVDYSGRLVIAGDPTLKLGTVGIPWQVLLKLYEPFTEYQILKNSFNIHVLDLIREHMGKQTTPDANELKRFLSMINEQPEAVNKLLRDELIRIAEEIVKEKVVIYKRD